MAVVGDVADEALTKRPLPTLYFPAVLDPGVEGADEAYPLTPREMTVVVHASIAPLGLSSAVRDIVRQLDPKIPVADMRAPSDLVSDASARMRLATILLVVAAGTSLCLGLIGVYGIVAYSANLRTGEIGVRVALGARSAQVTRLVMTGAFNVAMAGLAMATLPLTCSLG